MGSKLVNDYKSLMNSLSEMREEYKITPSDLLLKKIEETTSILKNIDSSIGTSSTSNNDYSLNENTNFSF